MSVKSVSLLKLSALSSDKDNQAMLEKRIEQDLKAALLSGDSLKTTTLRSIKSALLYVKVEKGKRESGLTEEEEIAVLAKESKKRQESADLYTRGNSDDRARTELREKAIIDQYLPRQLDEAELIQVVDEVISETGLKNISDMGKVIAAVKQKTAGAADGAMVARYVKERLQQ